MCGRYTLHRGRRDLAEHFGGDEWSETRITPRFNIAPSQEVPAVRLSRGGQRELVPLRWGLIPHWDKDAKTRYSPLTTRVPRPWPRNQPSETVSAAAEGQVVESCAVIVTEVNDLLRPVHDRMPVILDPTDCGAWLAAENFDLTGGAVRFAGRGRELDRDDGDGGGEALPHTQAFPP